MSAADRNDHVPTLEQVAARAGVSKGGLLYHFRDKAALAEGLLERLGVLSEQDAEAMAEVVRRRRATGGPAEKTFAGLVGLELRPRRLRDAANLFAALEAVAPAEVRVVILGQDPYPTPGHPIGLSFAVAPDVRPIPRSLVNIYAELVDER